MKEKRKRIGRVRPIVVNKIGMEIRLNITMEVIEGEDILINGVYIGKRSKDYLYLNNVSYNKKQLSKQLGQLCSNYKVVIIEKMHKTSDNRIAVDLKLPARYDLKQTNAALVNILISRISGEQLIVE
jgi:hypothetical protein